MSHPKLPRLDFKSAPPRHIVILEREDGSWAILEDEEEVLRAFRPKRDERLSRHRAYVRRAL